MYKRIVLLSAIVISSAQSNGQLSPTITSWIQNTTVTGYGGYLTNVQLVQYDSNYVYISATCIPGYSIGPWVGDPNIPANKNFVYEIPRHPVPNTGTLTNVPLGQVGAWTNGVSVFNALDANSYNNLGYWHQNAYVFEGSSFDNCLGHPAPDGQYHHHVSPKCLYSVTDSTHHSPIIGYAWDGYPIYGAYAYTDTNGTGPIKRMSSSYKIRSTMVHRDTLPNGTVLAPADYGPDVSVTALGSYQEDYIYTAGYGDLDVHNGRWCKTPEYPGGTYAYFVTIDATLTPQYPYTLGATYYGITAASDYGPGGGHVTPPGGTVLYTTGVTEVSTQTFSAEVFPNPASGNINLFIQGVAGNNFIVTLVDMSGKTVFTQKNIQPTILYSLNVASVPAGMYTMNISNQTITHSEKVLIKQ